MLRGPRNENFYALPFTYHLPFRMGGLPRARPLRDSDDGELVHGAERGF